MINKLTLEMIGYYNGDAKRIQHFLKVHSFCKLIGEEENLDKDELFVLESAALVHDIGIKISEMKYGNCNGKNQELEGPSEARCMLKKIGFSESVIERVAYLVGHHHTYTDIKGMDYQILVEADFLVNLFEDDCNEAQIKSALNKIFKTKSGINLCQTIFGIK